tara:strand:- start:35 stop:1021 length:987 start_codon:yes stop_codon:yes gene_type:complete
MFAAQSERRKLTTADFIKRANRVHGNLYDYSETQYNENDIRVKIICQIHGEFLLTPHRHLAGNGCPACSIEKAAEDYLDRRVQDFVSRAREVHGDKYDYGNISYKGMGQRVELSCPEHGEFILFARHHIENGQHCLIGQKEERRLEAEKDFINNVQNIHGDTYNYDKVHYIDSRRKIRIVCKKHGIFDQSPNVHLQGKGCPSCKRKSETEVFSLLKEIFGSNWLIKRNKTLWNAKANGKGRRICDFWLERDNNKIMVEYDGQHHFWPVCYGGMDMNIAIRNFEIQQKKDKKDKEFCDKNGIVLHRIAYYEDKEKSVIELKHKIGTFCI